MFFDLNCDKSLFDGLAIAEEKELCEQYMGKFPVIFLSLKSVDGKTLETAAYLLHALIRNEAGRLEYLLESEKLSSFDKSNLKRLMNSDIPDAEKMNGLLVLSQLLHKHYGQQVILLI